MKDCGITILKDFTEKDWRDPSCGINEDVQFHNSLDPEAMANDSFHAVDSVYQAPSGSADKP